MAIVTTKLRFSHKRAEEDLLEEEKRAPEEKVGWSRAWETS